MSSALVGEHEIVSRPVPGHSDLPAPGRQARTVCRKRHDKAGFHAENRIAVQMNIVSDEDDTSFHAPIRLSRRPFAIMSSFRTDFTS